MSISDADIAFALELFEDLGPLTTRKMMGGLCLYADGTIFAIIHSDGTLLLKGGANGFDKVLNEAGWARWSYARKDGSPPTQMPIGNCHPSFWTIRMRPATGRGGRWLRSPDPPFALPGVCAIPASNNMEARICGANWQRAIGR